MMTQSRLIPFDFNSFCFYCVFQVTTPTSLLLIHRRTPFICWRKSSASNRLKILHSHWPSTFSQNIVMSKRRTCTLTNIHGNASATQMQITSRKSTIMHFYSHQSQCAIATSFINVVSSNIIQPIQSCNWKIQTKCDMKRSLNRNLNRAGREKRKNRKKIDTLIKTWAIDTFYIWFNGNVFC